jgi:hypothetical protein
VVLVSGQLCILFDAPKRLSFSTGVRLKKEVLTMQFPACIRVPTENHTCFASKQAQSTIPITSTKQNRFDCFPPYPEKVMSIL